MAVSATPQIECFSNAIKVDEPVKNQTQVKDGYV
jgi:hypothetical protein